MRNLIHDSFSTASVISSVKVDVPYILGMFDELLGGGEVLLLHKVNHNLFQFCLYFPADQDYRLNGTRSFWLLLEENPPQINS